MITENTNKIIKITNIYPSGGQAGQIVDVDGICPTLLGYGAGGGGKEVKIVDMRFISNEQMHRD